MKYIGGKHAQPLRVQLFIKDTDDRGIGVFLAEPTVPRGTVLELSPVLPLK
jgi:hypothetical protein